MASKSKLYVPLLKNMELEEVSIQEDITDLSNAFDTVVNTVVDQCDNCDESQVDDQALTTYDKVKENEVTSVITDNLSLTARRLGRSLATADLILGSQVRPAVKKLMEEVNQEVAELAKKNNVVLNDVDPILESNVDIFDWEKHLHSEIDSSVSESVFRDRLNGIEFSETHTAWMSMGHANFNFTPYKLTPELKEAYLNAIKDTDLDTKVVETILDDLGIGILNKLDDIFVAGNGSRNFLECLYLADEVTDTYDAADMLRRVTLDISDEVADEIKNRFDEYIDCCILATCVVRTMRAFLRNTVVVMIRETGHYAFNPDSLQALEELGWTQEAVCKYTYCHYRNRQLPPVGITLDELKNYGDASKVCDAFAEIRNVESKQAKDMKARLLRMAIVTKYPTAFKKLELIEPEVELTSENDANIVEEANAVAGDLDTTEDNNLESLTYKFLINLCYKGTLVDKLYHALEDEMDETIADSGDITEDDIATMKTSAYAKVTAKLLVDNFVQVK